MYSRHSQHLHGLELPNALRMFNIGTLVNSSNNQVFAYINIREQVGLSLYMYDEKSVDLARST